MPWTAGDAIKHTKKATTAKAKSTWASVANDWLKKHPGDEAGAIKRANAVVGKMKTNEFDSFHGIITNMSALVSEKELEGQTYWVIPTILMVEGVHNGKFYSAEALEKSSPGWSGEPVVVWHPKGPDGEPVTANDPDHWEAVRIGQVFNVQMEGSKLKAEAWINQTKAGKVSPELVAMIKAGDRIEVSTGVYVDDEGEPGEWNGEQYAASAVNHRPDHLAFLPGGKGACSWEDGAGAPRIHAAETEEEGGSVLREMWERVRDAFVANEPSHDDIRGQLQTAVQAAHPPQGGDEAPSTVVMDVFDKSVVYARFADGKDQLYQQNYSVGADDGIELHGEPVAVRLRREYVPAVRSPEAQQSTAQEGGRTMERKDQVDALIAADGSRWSEEDRPFLTEVSDDRFARLTKEPEPEQPASLEDQLKADAPEDESPAVAAAREAFQKAGEAPPKENADPEDKGSRTEIREEDLPENLQRAAARERKYRERLTTELAENEQCKFSKDQLEAMDVDTLELLAQSMDVDADALYVGRSTGEAPEDNEDKDEGKSEPLAINWEEKKPEEKEG